MPKIARAVADVKLPLCACGCGREVTRNKKWKTLKCKYATDQCRQKVANRKRRTDRHARIEPMVCAGCGITFTPKNFTGNRKFCTHACQYRTTLERLRKDKTPKVVSKVLEPTIDRKWSYRDFTPANDLPINASPRQRYLVRNSHKDNWPRRFECPNYGDCEDYAIKHNWTSWSCDGCALRDVGLVYEQEGHHEFGWEQRDDA